MAHDWITVETDQVATGSGYPTQKMIDVLAEGVYDDLGVLVFAAGTVFVCYTDYLEGYGHVRNFYYKQPEESVFTLLSSWIVTGQTYYEGKNGSCSFRVAANNSEDKYYIYCVTDIVTTTDRARVVLGAYDLSQGESGSWNETTLTDEVHPYVGYSFPDLDVSYDGGTIIVVWSYRYTNLPTTEDRYYLCKYDVASAAILTTYTVILGLNNISTPKASILYAEGEYFWVHADCYVSDGGSSSAYSQLFYGRYSDGFWSWCYKDDIDLVDAQFVLDGYGNPCFLAPEQGSTSYLFKCYDVATSTPQTAEELLDATLGVGDFRYGLTYRNGNFYAFIYYTDTMRTYTKGLNETVWAYAADTGYDAVWHGYMVCQTTRNPVCADPDFFALVAMEVEGSTPFNKYCRLSGDVIPTQPSGSYYNDGIVDRAVNIEVGYESLGITLRGDVVYDPASLNLAPVEFIMLADDVLLNVGSFRVSKFDSSVIGYEGAINSLSYEVQDFTQMDGDVCVKRMKVDFDEDVTIDVLFRNENNEVQLARVTSDLAGDWLDVNFYGKAPSFEIINQESRAVTIRGIEFEVEQINV
jgi:hypothetical protein